MVELFAWQLPVYCCFERTPPWGRLDSAHISGRIQLSGILLVEDTESY